MEEQRVSEFLMGNNNVPKVIAAMAAKSGRLLIPIILAMEYMEGLDTRVPRRTQSRTAPKTLDEKKGDIAARCASVSGTACGAYFFRLLEM
jgi:hypothetical protein